LPVPDVVGGVKVEPVIFSFSTENILLFTGGFQVMAKQKHSKWGGIISVPHLFYENRHEMRIKPVNRPHFRGVVKRKLSDEEWRGKLR